MQKPTVGRIVHYQAFGTPGGEYKSVPRAAVVTQVHEGDPFTIGKEAPDLGLAVINPSGMFFNERIPYAFPPKPGCWNWPPREEERI